MPESQAPLLPDPPERPALEPFATVYLTIIAPEAKDGGWFEAMNDVSETDLRRITRRIEETLSAVFGHTVHAAIYVHALLVCGHFFYRAAERRSARQTRTADSAYSLVRSLLLYHDLDELYLRLS